MAKEYNKYEHSHVTIKHPTAKRGEGWDGTFDIVLNTGPHVWVHASYAHERHDDIHQVGDGRSTGFDVDGQCILSVPATWCEFWTIEEAESIECAHDVDERLLNHVV